MTPTIGTDFGGPTTTVVNGLIAENRTGIRSELLTTVGPGQRPESIEPATRLAQSGVTGRLFPRTGLVGRGEAWGLSPRLAFWLIRNIRRYDLIHLQYVWCMTSILGVAIARLAGVPVVLTPHESLTDFDIEVASRHPLLKTMKRVLRHLFLGNTDQLVLMSRLEQRDTRSGSVPVKIVSHAVLEYPAGETGGRSPGGEGLRIAFLGRNIEKKGIHLILEAIAMRPDRDRRLRIAGPAGNDEYRREIESLIRRFGIEDRVQWAGFVTDRGGYLSEADVLAMPSVYEGFGMVSAEAMCVGVPVVVPAMSGVAEIVDEFEAGVVMTVSSAGELDRAFARLEDDPELARAMGANGIRAANERLSFEAYARQTADIYGALIDR